MTLTTVLPQKIALAYQLASRSPDPSNQNGAVLLDGSNPYIVLGIGCNDFGCIQYTQEQLLDREWKLAHIEHAERAALFSGALEEATRGSILVCPWAACTDCARAIGRMGVKQLVVHTNRMQTTPARWQASVEHGLAIVRAHGCEVVYYDGPIDLDESFTIKANGEDWSPVTGKVWVNPLG